MENQPIELGLICIIKQIGRKGVFMKEENINELDRFSTDFRYVKILNENKNDKQISEKPEIGDLVKIINRDFWIRVTHTNYDFKTVVNTEYAGLAKNNESGNIILFNQTDILEIMKEKDKIR